VVRPVAGSCWITIPEEFAAAIRRDYEKYGKVVTEADIRVATNTVHHAEATPSFIELSVLAR